MIILGGCRKPQETVLTDIWILDLNPTADGILKWDRAFAQLEPIYGLAMVPAYGNKHLYAKFVHYNAWSATPKSPTVHSYPPLLANRRLSNARF